MTDEQQRAQGKDPGHEPLAVSIKAIALATIALIALVVLTILAMVPLSRYLRPRDAADEVDTFVELPVDAPQRTVGLNPNQAQDRLAREKEQREWLGDYAWLTEEEQVARIPIERAMEIVREAGLKTVTQPGASSPPTSEQPVSEGGSDEARQ